MAGLSISNGNGSTEQTPLVTTTTDAAVARSSFLQGDREASRQYHDSKKQHAASEDGHQTEGGFLKPIIFGGLDGILTSFAIVAGAAGGRLDPSVVLILGFSNIFADALSMGVGEFLSSKAENEWILSEREREEWYVWHFGKRKNCNAVCIVLLLTLQLDCRLTDLFVLLSYY